jgi:hypothetical protein
VVKLLAILLFSTVAWAKPNDRVGKFSLAQGKLWVQLEYPELVDENLKRRLESGLAATVVARAYLVREGTSRADALAVQTVRTAYDLWDEVYVSDVSGDGGARVYRDKRREDALKRISTLQVALVDQKRLSGQYRVMVVVELNPVSKELLAQVRKWLSRPREGAPLDGESYFGSFVSLFVQRKVGEAERVLQLRTQVYP